MKPILITLILMAGTTAIAYVQAQTVAPKRVVYEVCQSSRMGDSITEQTCAQLQDKYNVEFLCTQNNPLPSNHCWVETK